MQNSVVLDILEENRAEEWNVAKKIQTLQL